MKVSNIKIFISAPIKLSINEILKVSAHLGSKYLIPQSNISFWDRNTYRQSDFDNADAIIFINEDFKFKTDNVPPGMRRELDASYKAGKPVFGAYYTVEGTLTLYKFSVSSDFKSLHNIGGTGKSFDSLVDCYVNDSTMRYTDLPPLASQSFTIDKEVKSKPIIETKQVIEDMKSKLDAPKFDKRLLLLL